MDLTQAKSNLRRTKGIYAVKRSRQDYPRRKFHRPGRKENLKLEGQEQILHRNISKDLIVAYFDSLRRKERQRRQAEAEQVNMEIAQLHPNGTRKALQKYKMWTSAQDWPITAIWRFREEKEARNPNKNNKEKYAWCKNLVHCTSFYMPIYVPQLHSSQIW